MYQELVFPVLSRLDAEKVHQNTIKFLKIAERSPRIRKVFCQIFTHYDPRQKVSLAGLDFPNRIGLAAGFDKNAAAPLALASLGFGHVEVGTITKNPQEGNKRPRIFRLAQDHALINRLSFPNDGIVLVSKRLAEKNKQRRKHILGVNLGPNKERLNPYDAASDLNMMAKRIDHNVDYITLNVSSPNTPGLKDLQEEKALAILLSSFQDEQLPVFLKISPDLTARQLDSVLQVALDHKVGAIIATNTTTHRAPNLRSHQKHELGGLSGQPLKEITNRTIKYISTKTNGQMPVIGVGGVFTAQDAWEKIQSGATLVQIYTSLVYFGPFVVKQINQGLSKILDND